jgi:putative tricarboxylic transport membrane protein
MDTSFWRNKDFLSGCLLIAVGLFFAYVGRNYAFGTPSRMGPGFMPICLSFLLAVLGVTLSIRSFGEAGGRFEQLAGFRPLLVVLAGVVVFSYMLDPAGLVLSSFVLVLIVCCADRPIRPVETVALAAGLTLGVVLLFVTALGVPFELWPQGIR